MTRERLTLIILLASIFLVRAIHPDQPIVENYVGRQIPTAMVARNLERGSGFLRPQLDTAPFPNLFLVEPPIYAQLVASFRPIIGLDLEPTGRLVSAAAVALGAWGLFGLVRRREGLTVAFLALASFGLFPVMIRYGRAFQPDALMVGCLLAGLRGCDEYETSGNWRWAVFGGFVLAIGLAVKITVAWALIPFVLILSRWKVRWRLVASAVMLLPATAWYLYAWSEVAHPGPGSLANAESTNIWLKVLFSTEVWLRFSMYENLAKGMFILSFTPVGFVLAFYGLVASGKVDRLWLGWAVGCGLAILGLAAKWHHAYYWMVVAPLAAVGVGRGLVHLARFGRPLAVGLGSFLLAMCVVQSASTFKTPVEWESLNEATRQLKNLTQVEQLVVAPEAVLYYADVKGYRLEFQPDAMRRAANEWDLNLSGSEKPLALTEFYWGFVYDLRQFSLGATPGTGLQPYHSSLRDHLLVADVGSTMNEPRRRAWREAIRNRPNTKILADKPGYLIAELR
jgi:4-amino-4-deoxy-L-arabinose transferase-like glycosyltransferase